MKATFLIIVVGLAAGIYFGFGPYIEPHRVYRATNPELIANGWDVLRPWAAGPILAIYALPVFILAGIVALLMASGFMADERRSLNRHSKEASRRMSEANKVMEEAKRARQFDQALVAKVKEKNAELSRQAGKDNGKRVSAVGELKRRRKREDKMRQELAAAHQEIERLQRALPPESEAQ